MLKRILIFVGMLLICPAGFCEENAATTNSDINLASNKADSTAATCVSGECPPAPKSKYNDRHTGNPTRLNYNFSKPAKENTAPSSSKEMVK